MAGKGLGCTLYMGHVRRHNAGPFLGTTEETKGLLFGSFGPNFVANVAQGGFTCFHPAAKGVQQKEFGPKVTKKVTEASEKVTKK